MDKRRDKIAKRAMELYLDGKGSLKDAFKRAEDETLMDDIPEAVQDLFNLKRR